jgi:hypothetical protein
LSSEYNAPALMTLLLFLQAEQHPQASRKQAERHRNATANAAAMAATVSIMLLPPF